MNRSKNTMEETIKKFNKIWAKKKLAKTERYLYHISPIYNRESILKHGLNKTRESVKHPLEEKQRNFAHNTNQVTWDWYWLCIDGNDLYLYSFFNYYESLYLLNGNEELRMYVNQQHDIWRIDNSVANKKWYIDYIGWSDNFRGNKIDYYVFCHGIVPVNALTLCTLDIDTIEEVGTGHNFNYTIHYNPIIPRVDFINKFNFEPEMEFKLKTIENKNALSVNDNDAIAYGKGWRYASGW